MKLSSKHGLTSAISLVRAMVAEYHYTIKCEKETEALARQLASVVRIGDSVALYGELGVGKTVFARAFIRSLVPDARDVPSPTFTIMQTYDAMLHGKWVPVHHYDLYRLEVPEELEQLDWDEACVNGVVLVEWPQRAGRYLPSTCLEVHLHYGDAPQNRVVWLKAAAHTVWQERLLRYNGDDMTVGEGI